MAKFSRLKVLNTIIGTGLVPLLYHEQLETAKKAVRACVDGGARVLEFTNRGHHAYRVFAPLAEYCERELPELILGVGSIVDAPTAALFIAAGANFVVGPMYSEDIARLCNRRKIAYIPGCATVTEISAAEELGCEIVKIFPGGTLGGPAFVKALLAPCPWSGVMATGGVEANRESLQAWFKAGVKCVGIGSHLFKKEQLAAGDFQDISQTVRNVLAWIAEIRAKEF
ncbi:MAG: bifunctional 4-hydroxy-2-oxoglutarate aldolase/2-dehydro-3-deoxy-phosphogluconate aldolase [Thermoguttaceae bacterium]